MINQEQLLEQAKMLVSRIERISVDSNWARRSSGHRGTLLKWIEMVNQLETVQNQRLTPEELTAFAKLIEIGYDFLSEAAREKYH
jgi:hypothetical protein